MANAAQVLQQAHDLIESGDYQAARQILDAVRSSNENNPDFWWVYAHSLEDATEGKAAMERVRQLAPNYPGLETLTGGSAEPSTIKPLRPLAPLPPMGSNTAEEDEFAETGSAEDKPATRWTPMVVLSAMMLVLLFAAVIIMVLMNALNPNNGTATPERTAIVDDFVIPTSESQVITTEDATEETSATEDAAETEELAETEVSETEEVASVTEDAAETEEASETEDAVETEEGTTTTEEASETEEVAETEEASETEAVVETEEVAETEAVVETEEAPTEEGIVAAEETEVADTEISAEVIEEIGDFGVPEEGGLNEEESSLGQTLVVTICATPGPVASQNIINILNALENADVDLQAEALAFDITDCNEGSVILSLGVSAELVQSYWLGDTTASELLAALRRI